MANPEHLSILKQGVNAWNQWRLEALDITPDLSKADLSKADLRWADLGLAVLHGADLSEAVLTGADLVGAYLVGADLSRADLTEVGLTEADLSSAVLTGADLVGAYLGGAVLSGAVLTGTNLTEADLGKAVLRRAVLDGAQLSNADLRLADLSGADLSRADLSGAYLDGADLSRTDLRRADLTGAQIANTVFADTDLSEVKGLEAVEHYGPSSIGIDTIYRSKGNIPKVFLRGAGVPEDFITYMHSLASGPPIQFYSCFISYSTKDQEFAERLHADLQAKKVRVWFAPEDLKISDVFRQSIDQAIRMHDKLLVVLSAHSVTSDWVQTEVEAAFERERREKKLVLFPVMLDSAVMDTDQAWAADIRRTRHIGDFHNWKDHDAYKQVLDRLLRDLAQSEQ